MSLLSLGKRLKGLLKEKGITQRDMADAIGISKNHLSLIVTDEVDPGLNKLKLICHYLDARLEYVAMGTGPKWRNNLVMEPEAKYGLDLFEKFQALSEDKQRTIKELIELYYKQQEGK